MRANVHPAADLAAIAKLPEVRSAVRGDRSGAFLDAVNEADGETVAAVMGFVASTLAEAGDQLGLGALRRATLLGQSRAYLVTMQGDAVITALVDAKSVAAVEKALDASLPERG